MGESVSDQDVAGGHQQADAPTTRQCVSCGRTINWNSNVCPYCGHDYRMAQLGPAVPQKERSMLPVIGGVLILIAGLAALGMGVAFMAFDAQDIENWVDPAELDMSLSDLDDMLFTCGAIVIVFGVIAVLGGVLAIVRKRFVLAVVGGIFSILGVGFVVGAVLGLIGLILVAVGRRSFNE